MRILCFSEGSSNLTIIWSNVLFSHLSGTIVNNLEACDVVRSSHFKMASELLEV